MSAVTLGRAPSLGVRLRRFLFDPQMAEVALEFSSSGVVGARVESVRGRVQLRALAREAIGAGALVPALDNPGFARPDEIRDATRSVLSRIGAPPKARAALVVPDILARFRLFAQSEVATEAGKRNALVAFRMQKLLSFPAADVRVVSAWPSSPADPVLGIACSSSVVGAYEQAGAALGLDVGRVETSSMALLRGLQTDGDALLVRHDPAWLTLTLARRGWPVAVRSFDSTVALSPDECRREIASTAVFWRDRLNGERLETAQLHTAEAWFEVLAADIASAFGRAAEPASAPPALSVSGLPRGAERLAAPALAVLTAGA